KEKRSKVFGWVTTPAPSEAKSPRRDDGPGQTVAHQVALHHAPVDWSAYLLEYHHVAATRRPRTEASTRRADNAKKGIDKRPVTEEWAKARSAVPTCSVPTILRTQRGIADHLSKRPDSKRRRAWAWRYAPLPTLQHSAPREAPSS